MELHLLSAYMPSWRAQRHLEVFTFTYTGNVNTTCAYSLIIHGLKTDRKDMKNTAFVNTTIKFE